MLSDEQQISAHSAAAHPANHWSARRRRRSSGNLSRGASGKAPMSTEDPKPRRGRCMQTIVRLSHNYKFLTCVCILTILDAALVVMELIVDLLEMREVEASIKIELEKIKNMGVTQEHSGRMFRSETAGTEDAGAGGDHHAVYATIALVSRYGSIGILSLMVVWNVLRLAALQQHFFKSKLQVADGVVVIISLVLDVIFLPNLVSADKTLVAVVGLTWRIVRVVNNSLVLLHEIDHIQVKRYMHQAKTSWKRCLLLKREVLNLRNLCRKTGVSEADINDSKTAARLHYMRHKNQSALQSALVQSAALPVLYVLGDPASDLFYDNPGDDDDNNYKTSQMTVQCVHCTTIQRQMEEKRAQLPLEWRTKLTRPQAADGQQRTAARFIANEIQKGNRSPATADGMTFKPTTSSASDGPKSAKPSQPLEGQRKGRFISTRTYSDSPTDDKELAVEANMTEAVYTRL